MKKYIISLLCLVPFTHAMVPPNEWNFKAVKTALEASKTDPNSFLRYLPTELRKEIAKFPAAEELSDIRFLHRLEGPSLIKRLNDIKSLFYLGLDPNINISEKPNNPCIITPLRVLIEEMTKVDIEEESLYMNLIDYLIKQKKADINQPTSKENLHNRPIWYIATVVAHVNALKFFMQYKPELNDINCYGNTVFDIARANADNFLSWAQHQEAEIYLRLCGAKTGAELKAEQEQKK